MSPREKHIPDTAQRTSICLTPEDRAAIHWISEVRKGKNDRRTTTNDILVDTLWYFLEKTQGKTRSEIQGMIPAPVTEGNASTSNITEMPKNKKKR